MPMRSNRAFLGPAQIDLTVRLDRSLNNVAEGQRVAVPVAADGVRRKFRRSGNRKLERVGRALIDVEMIADRATSLPLRLALVRELQTTAHAEQVGDPDARARIFGVLVPQRHRRRIVKCEMTLLHQDAHEGVCWFSVKMTARLDVNATPGVRMSPLAPGIVPECSGASRVKRATRAGFAALDTPSALWYSLLVGERERSGAPGIRVFMRAPCYYAAHAAPLVPAPVSGPAPTRSLGPCQP